jgi:hypothetical protein
MYSVVFVPFSTYLEYVDKCNKNPQCRIWQRFGQWELICSMHAGRQAGRQAGRGADMTKLAVLFRN